MRIAAALLLTACALPAQFKSTVPLVVAPTTVTDAQGRYIDGLGTRDLALLDNNVPQTIQVESDIHPISLVVVVQASTNSSAILDKLGRSGALFTELLSGDRGETALITAGSEPLLLEDFTSELAPVSRALRNLRVQSDGAVVLDAIVQGLRMLRTRSPARRRVMLVIAERRDRGSESNLATLLDQAPRQNVAIYWLHYSPFLAAFTSRPKTKWDRMTDEEKMRKSRDGAGRFPFPEDEEILPPETPPGSLITLFKELKRRAEPDAAGVLTAATGGRTIRFLQRDDLEQAIQAVAEEVHRQYIVTFQPAPDPSGGFHTLRVAIPGRPGLAARTRAGYWSAP